MAAIRVKSGGAWTAPIANGKLNAKWGGGWFNPTVVYTKVGDPGGGYWVDTGYRGYPATPSNLWVHAWSYDAIALNWSAGGGGAPVSAWHLVQTDQNGNWINQVEVGGGPWGNFGMNWDTNYQFYVRAKAASGLYSPFYGPVRVHCGHPVQYGYGYVQRTRYWQSGHPSGARNANDPFWDYVPTSVHLEGMHWRNLRTPMSSVVMPGTNRTVNLYISTDTGFVGDYGNIGTTYSGDNRDTGMNNLSNGGLWGIVARGAGWSTTGNGFYMLWCDDFWLDGTEYYDNYEITSTIPEQGNYTY